MDINKQMKILLVEDASSMRKMEIKTLKSLGFENIEEAENGQHAITKLSSDPSIKLIISDWNMPVMDGFELLQWVRKNDKTQNIPFLMATGRGEKKELEKANEAGVSSFISKPFNKDELLEKIEEAFGIKKIETIYTGQQNLNRLSSSGKVRLNVVHIQITDHLTLGVAKHMINKEHVNPKHFELETQCLASWNSVAKTLEEGSADAAFILAPLAMDLFNYGVPIRLVLYAHKNGSCCVRNKNGGEYIEPHKDFFKKKSFYIPHTMSIHNMLGHIFFKSIGLNPGVTGAKNTDVEFEVVAPIKMPEFLAENNDACGYLVAEPLGTKAIAAGTAELQFLSSEIWENHPCCVVAFRDEIIQNYPDAVSEFTQLLIQAGKFIDEKPETAAQIAVDFLDPSKELGLKVPVLKNVLTEPKGIKTKNLYPLKSDLDFIQHYMHDKMGIGTIIDLDKFIDMKFADTLCSETDKSGKNKKINENEIYSHAKELLKRDEDTEFEQANKALLNLEGKYLKFIVDNQYYGIDILKIIEIIKMVHVTQVPNTPNFVKGVINLRGNIVPVIDLRLKLGIITKEWDEKSRIIIVENEYDGNMMKVGLIVDTVETVDDVVAANIDSAPELNNHEQSKFIQAMVKTENSVYILLNLNNVLEPIGERDNHK